MHQSKEDHRFSRHVRACNNAELPGQRLPFLVGDQRVGWVAAKTVQTLQDMVAFRCTDTQVMLDDPALLPVIAREISDRGLYRWRGEAFDVRARPDGPVLTQIDRGALPTFGIQAAGVHVNGLVRQANGLHLWIARRADDKLLDPGKLDHVVAGGVAAGYSVAETLVKEAGEEAAIPSALASTATPVAVIGYAMERPEGLRRDWLHCYDLQIPGDFVPQAADGEVAGFELWPIEQVVETVRDTDHFKFNVNLVLIDLFIRYGLIVGTEADTLRASLFAAPKGVPDGLAASTAR